ncbi:MAG TPA: leucine-rich repeat protein, partial [Firmicutes bacterium]|nr:leucine-rich repeat protein [Bacillota bacterium]
EPMTTSRIDKEPPTTRDGYTFDGWYTDKTFHYKVTFPYDVTKEQTLYAKWTQNEPGEIVFTVDGNGVLTGVSGLTGSNMTVEIPAEVNGITVTEIGKDVFKDNKNVGRLIIPDSVTTLGYRMCSGCTALREVRLPSGLTVIPDEAFDGCSSLQTVNFPDTLKEIRSDAFCGTALTEFIAPDSLTDIFGYAFKDCAGLTTVELTNVRKLSTGVFQNCTALESIRLPDSIAELSDHIFDGCASLTEIYMPDNPIAVSFTVFDGTAYYDDPSNWENGVLYADGYLIAANEDFASLTEYTVKKDTVVIADNAFSPVGYSSKLMNCQIKCNS